MPVKLSSVSHMAANIAKQVKKYLLSSDVISIASSGSIDANSMSMLAIVIRCASYDISKVVEELCGLASMNDLTKSTEIFRRIQELNNLKNGNYWIKKVIVLIPT